MYAAAGSGLEEAILANALSLAAGITLSVPPPCMIVEVRVLASHFVPLKAASSTSIRGFFAAAQPKPASDASAALSAPLPGESLAGAGISGSGSPLQARPAVSAASYDTELPWREDGQQAQCSSGEDHNGGEVFVSAPSLTTEAAAELRRVQPDAPSIGDDSRRSKPSAKQAGIQSILSSKPQAAMMLRPHTAVRTMLGLSSDGARRSVPWQFSSQAASQQGVKRKPAIPPPPGGKQMKISALLSRKADR